MRYLFYFNIRLYKFINDHTTYATQTPTSLTVLSKSDPNKHSKIVHEIIPFHNSKKKKGTHNQKSKDHQQSTPSIKATNDTITIATTLKEWITLALLRYHKAIRAKSLNTQRITWNVNPKRNPYRKSQNGDGRRRGRNQTVRFAADRGADWRSDLTGWLSRRSAEKKEFSLLFNGKPTPTLGGGIYT